MEYWFSDLVHTCMNETPKVYVQACAWIDEQVAPGLAKSCSEDQLAFLPAAAKLDCVYHNATLEQSYYNLTVTLAIYMVAVVLACIVVDYFFCRPLTWVLSKLSSGTKGLSKAEKAKVQKSMRKGSWFLLHACFNTFVMFGAWGDAIKL
eukprot:gene18710-6123_t